MFDAEQTIVIANDRFAEMYGQTSEQVKPGASLREIIEHRIAKGIYVGTTADEVLTRMRERVARGNVSYMTSRMGDGRMITVSIQPRPDGGWVTTHQDISEREKLKKSPGCGAQQHGARTCHVRWTPAAHPLQRAVCPKCIVSRQARRSPGITVRELLSHCVANGCYAGRTRTRCWPRRWRNLGLQGDRLTTRRR